MKLWQKIMSDNFATVAEGLDEFIHKVEDRPKKRYARVADNYYNARHDIFDRRVFYLDKHNNLVEDTSAANNQIPHPYFTEQIDQKVNYMLSQGVKMETDDEDLQVLLDDYIDEDFQLFLNEIVEGASKRGAEYAYARTDSKDRLKFQTSNLLTTDTVFDDNNEEVAVIRRYSETIFKDDQETTLTYAEVYTDDDVKYFVSENNKPFIKDETVDINPSPHVLGVDDDGNILERSYGRIPFYRLANNRQEDSDLVPIKALIDDYDMMASFLSNNLEDYDKPIYVITGAKGEDIARLRQRIKENGVVDVGTPSGGGSLDLKTYQIPYEARKAKMEIDKEGIYKFGMAFDSSQAGGSNVTNIEIKSRYSLLDLKCNKLEPRLRSLIKWCLELILQDIERKHSKRYDVADIKVILERNTIFNDTDTANREQIEAQTRQTDIQTLIMAYPYIGDLTVLERICETLGLDIDDVKANLQEQELPLDEGVDYDQEAEQMAEGNN